MTKYKGKTVHQSAAKLLERMKLRAAARMAESYAESSDPDTDGRKHWNEVSDLLNQTHAFETNAIYEQAEQDDKEMPPKQSKQKPTTTPSPKVESAAAAQTSDEELERVTDLCKAFDRKLTDANNNLARHAESFKANAVHAMTYADNVFKAAAQIQVFTYVIQGLTDDNGQPAVTRSRSDSRQGLQVWDTVPYVKEYAQKEVNRRAQSPTRSTSQCSNMMESEILSAWAEVLDIFTWR